MIRRFARTVASPFRALGRSAFYRRLEAVPWGVVITVLATVVGLVGVARLLPPSEPLSVLIGSWQRVFDGVYLVAGLTMFFGIGLALRWLHAFGVVLLGTSVAIRLIVLVGVFGPSRQTVVGTAFYVAIEWAVIVNARALLRMDVTVQYRRDA